jgi:hypothetical protein
LEIPVPTVDERLARTHENSIRVLATPAAGTPGLGQAVGLLAVRIVIALALVLLAFVLVEAWRPDLVVGALDLLVD